MKKLKVGQLSLTLAPNENFYYRITVTEDVEYDAKWIKNEKGNAVRKSQVLSKGEYEARELYTFRACYDNHFACTVEVNGFTFILSQYNEYDEIKIKYVELKRRKAPSFY